MDSLKLAKTEIALYRANGKHMRVSLSTLRVLKEAGRIARMITRKDGAVTRAYLLAEKGEIAKRITAQATVVEIDPGNFWHRENMHLLRDSA